MVSGQSLFSSIVQVHDDRAAFPNILNILARLSERQWPMKLVTDH